MGSMKIDEAKKILETAYFMLSPIPVTRHGNMVFYDGPTGAEVFAKAEYAQKNLPRLLRQLRAMNKEINKGRMEEAESETRLQDQERNAEG